MGRPSLRQFERSRISTLQGVAEEILTAGGGGGGGGGWGWRHEAVWSLTLLLLSLALEECADVRATGGVLVLGRHLTTPPVLGTGLGCTSVYLKASVARYFR